MRRVFFLYLFIFLIVLIIPGLLAYRLGIILGGVASLPGLLGISFFLYFWGRRFPGIYIPGTGLLVLFSLLTVLFFGAVGNQTARQFFSGLRGSLQTATVEVAEGVQGLTNQMREANRIWLAPKETPYYREDGKGFRLKKDTKVFLLQEEKGGTQRFGWFLLPNQFGHFDPKAGSEKVRFAFSDLKKPEEEKRRQSFSGSGSSRAKKSSAAKINLGPAGSAILLPVEIAPSTKVLEGHGSLVISWQGGTGFVINCPDAQVKVQRFSDAGWIKRGTALGAFPWNIMGSNQGKLEIKALRVEFLGPAQKGFTRRLFIEPLGGKVKVEGELEFRQLSF